jgi:hypothetical protein
VLRRLVVVLLVLAGLLAGAEVVLTHLAERALAGRVQAATGAASATVDLNGFWALGHLVIQGEVPSAQAVLHDVPVGALTLERVDAQLHDVRLERRVLFADRRITVDSVARAQVTAVVSAAELSAALGHPILLPGHGLVETDLFGVPLELRAELVDGDVLVLGTPSVPLLRVNLGVDPFLSACQLSLRVQTGQVVAGCTMQPVPSSVLAAVSADR